jgi:hypothetical protein
VQATEQLLEAEDQLSRMRHPDYSATAGGGLSALEARLGSVLRQRNVKVGDIVREWDSNSE